MDWRAAGAGGAASQKSLQQACQRDPGALAQWQMARFPEIERQARREKTEIYFRDESGFRADAAQGRTWSLKGQNAGSIGPGQRQGISAASAVNSKGGLNSEKFIGLLKQMIKGRRRALHLVLENLPTHKTRAVRTCIASLEGKLTLHILPGYAPDLNPDELIWNYAKRTGSGA